VLFEGHELEEQLLYPFSNQEKHRIFQKYVNSFEYSVLTTSKEQEQLNHEQNLIYTQFIESCSFRKHTYVELVQSSNQIIDKLTELTVKYDAVTKETSEFQTKSDSLLNEYTSYMRLNDDLKTNLRYYESLDKFMRKLNNPNPNIVKRESFKQMLAELDASLDYVSQHKDHKESDMFKRRFRQCLIRSLTLIRNYVVNHLKNVRDDISYKLGSITNTVTQDALIYTRFGSDLSYLHDVVRELYGRADDEEASGLLQDCYNNYFNIRSKFISPRLHQHFQGHSSDAKSMVQHSQSNISYFTKVLKDEYDLFYQIFPQDHNESLINWFQQLADPLYDDLRNYILRERSVTALCEMITLLEKYYEYEEHYDSSFETMNLGKVFEPVLQDVQSRLVFRAQMFVEENIVKYKPSSKDFAIGSRKHSTSDVDMSGMNGMKDWYTPLQKGISLLSKIYELVTSSVFDDLAHNIVHDCIISLKSGYPLAVTHMGKLDADLFLLKNLLMLKEHIQNFDIEYVSSETFLDFSGIGDILNKLRNGKYDIFGLVQDSVPKVVKNMIDAREELTVELRNVVHQFTQDAITQMMSPINKDDTALDDTRILRDNIEEMLPRIRGQIEIYIQDEQVVIALIDGIQELIIQQYEIYYHGNSGRLEDLVDVDTMIAFIGQVVSKMFEEAKLDTQMEQVTLDVPGGIPGAIGDTTSLSEELAPLEQDVEGQNNT
jgi:CobQ-like glutamine amidotransferase family enzyme